MDVSGVHDGSPRPMCEGRVTVFGGERGEIQFNSILLHTRV